MPKSKHRRKGDKRPVKRSGKNEGQADYRTGQPMVVGQQSTNEPLKDMRRCKFLDRVAQLVDIFSEEECTDIINNALNNWTEQESKVQRDRDGKIEQNFEESVDYRNTTLFIPPGPDEMIFSRILGTIMEFNDSENGYGFEIKGLAEPPNLMRYEAANLSKHKAPGKYDWHIDVGPGPIPSMRKLSYSILMNPGEYEGGDFVHRVGRMDVGFEAQSKEQGIPVEAGTMILFPSYILHRIADVTSGTRYSMVGWVHGNSFK